MKQKRCKIYPFLKAVRGNWHNAVFIKCEYDSCPYGRGVVCEGFLMAVDAEGAPILVPIKVFQQLCGESIESEGCRAILKKQTIECIYGLYMEWHIVDSAACPLLELCPIHDGNCGC